jgi:hypothetical protein
MHKIRITAAFYEWMNVEYSFVLDDDGLLYIEQLSFKVNVVDCCMESSLTRFNKSILKVTIYIIKPQSKPTEPNSAKFSLRSQQFLS